MGNRGRRQARETEGNDLLLGHTSEQGLDVAREYTWMWEPSNKPLLHVPEKHRGTTVYGGQGAVFGTPKSQANWPVFLSLIILSVSNKEDET